MLMFKCISFGQSLLGWIIFMKLDMLPLVANLSLSIFYILKSWCLCSLLDKILAVGSKAVGNVATLFNLHSAKSD